MRYSVVWTKKAKKELSKLPPKQQLLLASWVKDNLEGCEAPSLVKGALKLSGPDSGWRFRVGSYRIIAQEIGEELVVKIVRVGHRQGVYGNMPKI